MAASAKTFFENVSLYGKKTLAHKACEEGSVEALRVLSNMKVDLEKEDIRGFTPLMVAFQHKNIECFTLLLECGVNPNVKDAQGDSILHVACAQLNLPYVRLLLEHGADPNILDEFNNTPLYMVFHQPEVALVRLLLEKGANPNALNKFGRSPMYSMWDQFYSTFGTINSVRLMLEHGASIEQLGDTYETALTLACEKTSASLVHLFLEYGAPGEIEALMVVKGLLKQPSGCYNMLEREELEKCHELLVKHFGPRTTKRPRTEVEDEEEPNAKRARSSTVKIEV